MTFTRWCSAATSRASTRSPDLFCCAAIALCAAGCNPVLVPTPLQLGETAPALEEGQASFTAQGGGATAGIAGSGGAVAARVRTGIGDNQEIGAEGFFGYADTGNNPYRGQFGGGKLSYKRAFDPHFAVILGAGFGTATTGSTIGSDIAFVVSGTGDFRPYIGARGAYARRVTGTGVPDVFAVNVPLGLSYAVTSGMRLFVEGGAAVVGSKGHGTGPVYLSLGVSFEGPHRASQ
jgi:hypothetical protein